MMLHRYTLQPDPGTGTVGENIISEPKMRNDFSANKSFNSYRSFLLLEAIAKIFPLLFAIAFKIEKEQKEHLIL